MSVDSYIRKALFFAILIGCGSGNMNIFPQEGSVVPLEDDEAQIILKEIVKKAEANHKANLETMRDYNFWQDRQIFELKKREWIYRETLTYFYYFSEEYNDFRSTLMKRDGNEVSAKEQKQHDKEEEKRLRKEAKMKQREETAPDEKKKEKRSVEIAEDEIIKHLFFFREGETEYGGVKALVLRFEPKPDVAPKGIAEKILRYVEGEVWVGADTYQLLELTYNLSGKVRPAAHVKVKEFSLALEMGLIDEKYWFPIRTEFHIEGSFLGALKFNVKGIHKLYDFKRFRVSTEEDVVER